MKLRFQQTAAAGILRTRSALICVIAVVALGILKIFEPLGGDQSLFLVGAHELHEGASLYRDFWDLKQPAIYAFYFLATSLGDYSAIGVHRFELLYLTLFAIVLIVALRRSHSFARVASWAPLGAIGFYYLATGSFEAIQVESLVAFPLFVTLLFIELGFREERATARLAFFAASGFAAAIVLAFKIIFLPILVALWLAAILANRPKRFVPLATALLAASLGGALVCLAIGIFFAMQGTLAEALGTWFVLPPRIVRHVAHEPFAALLAGIRWFVHRFAGMVVLAIAGAAYALRRAPDTFALGSLAWIASGILVIVLQVTSWFQYQWLLLAAPIGMLAILGARVAYDNATDRRAPVGRRIGSTFLFVIAAIAFPAQLLAKDAIVLARNHFASTADSRERYRDAVSPVYKALRADAAFVKPDRGSLYVIGDPTFYVVADRVQAIALNGSSVRLFLPEQWTLLENELAAARPRYIYRSHGVKILSRTLLASIEHDYRLVRRGTLGDLYIARDRHAERRRLRSDRIGDRTEIDPSRGDIDIARIANTRAHAKRENDER